MLERSLFLHRRVLHSGPVGKGCALLPMLGRYQVPELPNPVLKRLGSKINVMEHDFEIRECHGPLWWSVCTIVPRYIHFWRKHYEPGHVVFSCV